MNLPVSSFSTLSLSQSGKTLQQFPWRIHHQTNRSKSIITQQSIQKGETLEHATMPTTNSIIKMDNRHWKKAVHSFADDTNTVCTELNNLQLGCCVILAANEIWATMYPSSMLSIWFPFFPDIECNHENNHGKQVILRKTINYIAVVVVIVVVAVHLMLLLVFTESVSFIDLLAAFNSV